MQTAFEKGNSEVGMCSNVFTTRYYKWCELGGSEMQQEDLRHV